MRRSIAALLAVAGAALLVLAGGALYAEHQLSDRQAFGERSAAALNEPAVREAAAERIAQAMIEQGDPDLIAVRPLLLSAADALLRGDPVRRLVARAAADAQPALLEGGSPLAIELTTAGNQVLRALRSVSPELAGAVPPDLESTLLELRPDDRAVGVARAIDRLAEASTGLLVAALALLALALLASADRRSAVLTIATALAIGSALVVAALAAARAFVAGEVAAGVAPVQSEAAVRGLWDAYLGDLRAGAMAAAAAALILAGVASATLTTERMAHPARRLLDIVSRPSPGRYEAIGRGLGVVCVGGLLLLAPGFVIELLALAAGGVLLAIGAAEIVAAVGARGVDGVEAGDPAARARRRRFAVAGVVTAAIALPGSALAVSLAVGGAAGDATPTARPDEGCNGSRALCERRLNEVAFAATHNSFAAAEMPGWIFANQRHGIARQLEDGIRGLFLDPHFGVRTGEGLVRTDLRHERVARNRVARELSPEALEAADLLVEQAGGGALEGEPEVFLCHTLCELGAEPMVDELRVVGEFLDRNPDEVVIVFIEPFVGPEAIERTFAEAGLTDQLAELEPGRPLPTLGELIAANRRIVVLTERGGGVPAWYHQAFRHVQDTPLGAVEPEQMSCRRFRGSPDSPILMLNHWADAFPPSARANQALGHDFLRERVARCEREREMRAGLLVVDFYERSGVVEVAAELNSRPVGVLARPQS